MEKVRGYNFGTFAGVFTPSILTIIGVVMYLRFGWVLGSVGLAQTLLIVVLSSAITFLTGLSISALATNLRMKGGGAYFIIARSFGIEIGSAVGIPLFASQAIAVAFYIVGFTEALTMAFPEYITCDPRLISFGVLAVLALVATFSASVALKTQFVVMALIGASLVSFSFGHNPPADSLQDLSQSAAALGDSGAVENLGFWAILAIFFPAVTGILSGLGMSGDLKNPAKSIPLGTIGAVLTGLIIYLAVPIALYYFVGDNRDLLLTDSLVMMRCARIPQLIILGIFAATLSSALGSLLAAPRTLQALANDGALPKVLARGFGQRTDPHFAALVTIALTAACIYLGDINIIAPILTIINLSAYALLNLSAMLEELMDNPSWRPTFRVHYLFSLAGFLGCFGMMFMISPLATGIATFVCAAIWHLESRRSLVSTWGDMRTGLLMFLTHFILNRIAALKNRAHAWRPNLLVLAQDTQSRLNEFVKAISSEGGFANYGDPVFAKELVRFYGYGALQPNTILYAEASREHTESAIYALRNGRNVLFLNGSGAKSLFPNSEMYVDVWWRGPTGNVDFMLAIAQLILRSPYAPRAKLRLCHILEPMEDEEKVREAMQHFLERERLNGEVVIAKSNVDPLGRIAIVSGQSPVVFVGLRRPRLDETVEEYSNYLEKVRYTVNIPSAVFACVADGTIFKGIFNER